MLFQQAAQPRLQDPEAFLQKAFHAGHRELHRYSDMHALAEVPRTTIVACIIQDNRAWWAHVGDSRLYLIRRGQVLTRTRDHSKVEALLRLGFITEEQAATHPERNKVLNCLGSPLEPSVEVQSQFSLRARDSVLLCSDGFWSGVDEADMAKALDEEPVGEVVPRLVQRAVAMQGAGADNTTALAVQWSPGADVDDGARLSSHARPHRAMTATTSIRGDRGPAAGSGDIGTNSTFNDHFT
jgi:protein phosphatase